MIWWNSIKMKGLIEVRISEKALSSNNFLEIIQRDGIHSNLTLLEVRLVNGIWLEDHLCNFENTFHNKIWLYQWPGIADSSFLVLGAIMLRIASTFWCMGWIPCMMIQYLWYSIYSAKVLDLKIGYCHSDTRNSLVESLARTISNLSRWSLMLLFVSINK
jgi:hypothetical protein